MSDTNARVTELRERLASATDLEVFAPAITSLREISSEDSDLGDELFQEVREALDLLQAAHPIRAQRASHWTFSNHTALVDPCSVKLTGDRKFDPGEYGDLASGLARTLRVRNSSRWEKKLTARYGDLLAELEALEEIEGLEILEQSLGPEGVAALASSPHLKNLRALSISGSKSGLEGARAIASNAALANLEILVLSQGRLGVDGVEALASSPHLTNLRVLVLEENQLMPSAVEAIAGSATFSNLTHLVLHSNKAIGADGVRHLAHARHLESLTDLRMMSVNMRTTGAKVLAVSPLLERLEALDVRANGVTDKGKEVLRQSPHLSSGCELQV